MEFILGIMVGIFMCLFVVSIELWLKKSIVNQIEYKLKSFNKEKGSIISTLSEEDIAISEIIQKNAEEGRDTRMSELYEN